MNGSEVRELESNSIRRFMEESRSYLKGRVLDFGSGKQPYRDLVSGTYEPHEINDRLPPGDFDAVMCNQVMEYMTDPAVTLLWFRSILRKRHGYLVMTYPTNWDEVEAEDLWRFTKTGMERLLSRAGFDVVTHERRAEVNLGGFRFPLGYGVVARSR